MSNKFCRHLSNGYKLDLSQNNTLLWSPCCYYSKKVPLLDKEAFEREINYTASATDWLPECSLCQQMEASQAGSQISPRLASFNRIPSDLADKVCGNLELSYDAKCNAACLSCGSYISSTWQKYEYKYNIKDIGPIVTYGDELSNQVISTIPLNQLDELYILGGEPFYSTSGNIILRHLRDTHTNINQVKLRYQTNGSMSPDEETRDLWQGFKSVEISFSIDGIGDKFEYLRWPLKWHQVEQNVNNLLTTTDVIFSINATINPLNALYFQEIDDWVTKTIPKDRLKWPDTPARPNRCLGTLDLNKTPPLLRETINRKYGDEHRLSKIFNNLEIDLNYAPMGKYLRTHDYLRDLDWRDVFPDIAPYFNV